MSFNIFYTFSTLFYSFLFNTGLAFDPCDKIRTSGTGTVLFNPTDIYKTCWSQEEIAVLTARVILEDIVPDTRLISVQCNADIEDLVEYFKVAFSSLTFRLKLKKNNFRKLSIQSGQKPKLESAI